MKLDSATKMANTEKREYTNYSKFVKLPLVLIGCYLLVFLVDPNKEWDKFFDRDLKVISSEIIFTILLCIMLIIVSLISAKFLDRWFTWEYNPLTRFALQFCIQIFAAAMIFLTFLVILFVMGDHGNISDLEFVKIRQGFGIYVILSIFISFVYSGTYFFQQWRKSTDEANALSLKSAKFKQIALEAELQSLKLQLDPHFMFNNFSTLSALISEDPQVAQLFLDNLSKVYRYMIVNIPKNIVTLEEEMDFANTYFYLMKIRLADNISMDVDIEPALLKKGIPPITIQLLIENALKHNMASKKKPLVITITGDDNGDLLIINSLQRINYIIPSTKMGLRNIESRYNILTDKSPVITETAGEFKIKLPLLDLNNSK